MLVFLQLYYFTLCREVGVAAWLLQPASFCLADVALLGQELWVGHLSSFFLFSLAFSLHTRMPKANTVKYQLHLQHGSGNVALTAAELQCEAPGFGSRVYPAQPTPSHCQTDALKIEECVQMGCCLSFRPTWFLFIELNIALNFMGRLWDKGLDMFTRASFVVILPDVMHVLVNI